MSSGLHFARSVFRLSPSATFRFLLRYFLAEFQFQMSRNTSYLLTGRLPACLDVRLLPLPLSLPLSLSVTPSLSLSWPTSNIVWSLKSVASSFLTVCVCVCGAWSAFKLVKLCLVGVAIFVAACCASCSR